MVTKKISFEEAQLKQMNVFVLVKKVDYWKVHLFVFYCIEFSVLRIFNIKDNKSKRTDVLFRR